MTGLKEVYIVDLARPWKPVRMEYVSIVEGKKFVWADNCKRRFLLGSSAFFIRASAERRRKCDLERIVANGFLRHHSPGRWELARQALLEDRLLPYFTRSKQ